MQFDQPCTSTMLNHAKISSKEEYDSSELDRFHCEGSTDRYQPLYNYEVERLLSKLRLTAAGSGGIPA